jgi:hypothetical protein
MDSHDGDSAVVFEEVLMRGMIRHTAQTNHPGVADKKCHAKCLPKPLDSPGEAYYLPRQQTYE